jgi:DNA-binding transcriptional LysR family regulator
MSTDLNSLVMFAQVVQSNSFSQAARRLRMPISTVSRRVSELEKQLGVRLIERSTRRLRLTDVGSEVFEHAQKGFNIHDAVMNIASNHLTCVSGTLRISIPPTLADSILSPVISRFHQQYPDIRVQVFVTDRIVNQIEEGIDLAFRIGPLEDSSLVVRHLLSYRHRLVASPAYLDGRDLPRRPQDLRNHRLVAFSLWGPRNNWTFSRIGSGQKDSIDFEPHVSINNYSEMASLLMSGAGIGELPPMVQPDLLRGGRLIEVMPQWRFQPENMSIVHLGNHYGSRAVRLFKEVAAELIPTLFPKLSAA